MANGRGSSIAVLDVGSSKISCFIVKPNGKELRLAGVGHQPAQGMKSGSVVDLEAAEAAIRATVFQAERMAGETIREVTVGFSGGPLKSEIITAETAIHGPGVSSEELGRLQYQCRDIELDGERDILHCIPVDYAIDGNGGIREPHGMYGVSIAARMHVLSAGSAQLRNLAQCIERCPLSIQTLTSSAYAAGLSVLEDWEMDLGVTLIDIGGATTNIAVYFQGNLVFADMIPVGGKHITNDIARGLSTPVKCAERLKTLHGNALVSSLDHQNWIEVAPLDGEDVGGEARDIRKSDLIAIIRARVEEILELSRERLERVGLDKRAGQQLVLTGGAAEMPGLVELAGQILGKNTRIGIPHGIAGLSEQMAGPAFAGPVGLLHVATRRRTSHLDHLPGGMPLNLGKFGKVGRWLRENLW